MKEERKEREGEKRTERKERRHSTTQLINKNLWCDCCHLDIELRVYTQRRHNPNSVVRKVDSWPLKAAVQGLGLHASTTEGEGSIPGRGTKIPQAARSRGKGRTKSSIRWGKAQGLSEPGTGIWPSCRGFLEEEVSQLKPERAGGGRCGKVGVQGGEDTSIHPRVQEQEKKGPGRRERSVSCRGQREWRGRWGWRNKEPWPWAPVTQKPWSIWGAGEWNL